MEINTCGHSVVFTRSFWYRFMKSNLASVSEVKSMCREAPVKNCYNKYTLSYNNVKVQEFIKTQISIA